jgi:hypothetical protein
VSAVPVDVACMQCSALVRTVDLRAHEAWHAGLNEAVVRTAREQAELVVTRGGSSS